MNNLKKIAIIVMAIAVAMLASSCDLISGFIPGNDPAPVEHVHELSEVAEAAASCTEAGTKAYYKCSGCDKLFADAEGATEIEAPEAIAALGHTEETVAGSAATCTATGLTEGKKCSVCGVTTVAQEVIPTTEHAFSEGACTACGAADPDYVACEHEYEQNTFYHPELVAATCATTGVAVFECTKCDHYYTEVSPIDPEAHAFWGASEVITEANCATKTDGLMKVYCDNGCGQYEEQAIYYSEMHDWDIQTEVAATCTTGGEYYAVCTICEEVESYTSEAAGHYNWFLTCGQSGECMECGTEFAVEHDGAPATCTEPMFCYNCFSYIGEALGHSFSEGVCTVCEAEDPDYVPCEHEYEQNIFYHPELVAATCCTPGVAVFECTKCDYYYTEEAPIDPEAHAFWGTSEVITEANCATKTNGLMKVYCDNGCGQYEEQEIYYSEMHDWDVQTSVEATCTTAGEYYAVCTICEEVDSYTSEAAGHYNWFLTCGQSGECLACGTEFAVEHEGDPATCTEPMFCYNCFSSIGEALGHSFSEGVCTVCGEVYENDYTAAIDNSFVSDKENTLDLLFATGGAWGISTSGAHKVSLAEGSPESGIIAGLDKVGNYVYYEFVMSEAGFVDFVWNIAGNNYNSSTKSNDGIADMANHMTVTIDGNPVSVSGIALPAEGEYPWWNLQNVIVKDIYLEAGVHTFKCDITAAGGLNVGSMTIKSTAETSVRSANITSASVSVEGEKVYYVFTMEQTGYTAEDIKFWHNTTDSYDIASFETVDGVTTVKIDVTDLAVGTVIDPHMSFGPVNYVNGSNNNGDIRGDSVVYEEGYVKGNDKCYIILTNWSMPSLRVAGSNYMAIQGADIYEEDGKVYYTLTYRIAEYDPATFEFFDGNTVYAIESYSTNGTLVTFKFDVTDMAAGATIWPHLRVNGTNWDGASNTTSNNGDVKVSVTTETITLNGKTYTLKAQYSMPTLVVAAAA